jgi:hypothetical protein
MDKTVASMSAAAKLTNKKFVFVCIEGFFFTIQHTNPLHTTDGRNMKM